VGESRHAPKRNGTQSRPGFTKRKSMNQTQVDPAVRLSNAALPRTSERNPARRLPRRARQGALSSRVRAERAARVSTRVPRKRHERRIEPARSNTIRRAVFASCAHEIDVREDDGTSSSLT
jgi:hypothetical protein